MKDINKEIESEEIDPYLADILYDCIIGGWERIESDGCTYVYDKKVVETIRKILEHYTPNDLLTKQLERNKDGMGISKGTTDSERVVEETLREFVALIGYNSDLQAVDDDDKAESLAFKLWMEGALEEYLTNLRKEQV